MSEVAQPYIVIAKFDKQENLKARVMQAGGVFTQAVKELGPSQYIASAYDGSMVAFLVSCALTPDEIHGRLLSPKSGKGSPLGARDCVVVLAIEGGTAPYFAKITDWLSTYATTYISRSRFEQDL